MELNGKAKQIDLTHNDQNVREEVKMQYEVNQSQTQARQFIQKQENNSASKPQPNNRKQSSNKPSQSISAAIQQFILKTNKQDTQNVSTKQGNIIMLENQVQDSVKAMNQEQVFQPIQVENLEKPIANQKEVQSQEQPSQIQETIIQQPIQILNQQQVLPQIIEIQEIQAQVAEMNKILLQDKDINIRQFLSQLKENVKTYQTEVNSLFKITDKIVTKIVKVVDQDSQADKAKSQIEEKINQQQEIYQKLQEQRNRVEMNIVEYNQKYITACQFLLYNNCLQPDTNFLKLIEYRSHLSNDVRKSIEKCESNIKQLEETWDKIKSEIDTMNSSQVSQMNQNIAQICMSVESLIQQNKDITLKKIEQQISSLKIKREKKEKKIKQKKEININFDIQLEEDLVVQEFNQYGYLNQEEDQKEDQPEEQHEEQPEEQPEEQEEIKVKRQKRTRKKSNKEEQEPAKKRKTNTCKPFIVDFNKKNNQNNISKQQKEEQVQEKEQKQQPEEELEEINSQEDEGTLYINTKIQQNEEKKTDRIEDSTSYNQTVINEKSIQEVQNQIAEKETEQDQTSQISFLATKILSKEKNSKESNLSQSKSETVLIGVLKQVVKALHSKREGKQKRAKKGIRQCDIFQLHNLILTLKEKKLKDSEVENQIILAEQIVKNACQAQNSQIPKQILKINEKKKQALVKWWYSEDQSTWARLTKLPQAMIEEFKLLSKE